MYVNRSEIFTSWADPVRGPVVLDGNLVESSSCGFDQHECKAEEKCACQLENEKYFQHPIKAAFHSTDLMLMRALCSEGKAARVGVQVQAAGLGLLTVQSWYGIRFCSEGRSQVWRWLIGGLFFFFFPRMVWGFLGLLLPPPTLLCSFVCVWWCGEQDKTDNSQLT